MEIPYIVEPRKDTGLNNSKIGIWLFLASEVMLFGGLFSGYIFLRIYADYPWPERTLPVLPGLINTFILIGSSITVVFAWVSLKLRQWRKFQIYMAITIICAGLFMVLKGIEYNAKFHHQAIRLDDYTVVEGHAHAQDGSHDKDKPTKNLNVNASTVSFDLERPDEVYFETLADQYEKGAFVLGDDVVFRKGKHGEVKLAKGEALTWDVVQKAHQQHKSVAASNSEIATKIRKEVWSDLHDEYPGLQYYKKPKGQKQTLNEIAEARIKRARGEDPNYIAVPVTVISFVPGSGSFEISVSPSMGKLSNPKQGEEGSLALKDNTLISGIIANSSIILAVDGIDFRHTVMKADEKGIDPVAAVNNSWLLKDEKMKRIWEKHQIVTAKLAEELKAKDREPSENDIYRINWQEIVAFQRIEEKGLKVADLSHEDIMAYFPGDLEGFAGPSHKTVDYPEITVPREQVRFESVFSPRWNTYYATYFTITGLHGLHVIAGALVLAYYLFFGRKMYNENPEWLANRVEVGGLFWHFVDLVWIFLFPILYLM